MRVWPEYGTWFHIHPHGRTLRAPHSHTPARLPGDSRGITCSLPREGSVRDDHETP